MDKPPVYSFNPYLWGGITFTLGLLFSLLIVQNIRTENNAAIATLATKEANTLANDIAQRLELYQYGLRSARAQILTKGEGMVTSDDFRNYMESREIDIEFPGARGMGFIRRVPLAQEAEFVAHARATGQSDFSIRQLTPHNKERYVIEYIEPVARNKQAVGLDIGSETARRAAADAAMREGDVRLTAPITLVQATGKSQQSFLILMPIYRTWVTPATEKERIKAAFGWSYAPLIMEEVLAKLAISRDHFYITLTDVTDANHVIPFYASDENTAANSSKLFPQQVVLTIFGRQWQLDLQVTPQFIKEQHLPKPNTVLFWGLIFSALIGMLIAALCIYIINRQHMINQQARLAAIVHNSSDAIIATDTDDIVLSWNKGAETIFGYSEEATLGEKLLDLLTPTYLLDEGRQLIQRLLDGENIVNFETQRKRRDGAIIDVSLNYSPLRNEKGQIISFSKIVRDISEQKAARSKILELNYNLERQVNQRTQELNELNQMLNNVLAAATEVAIIVTDLEGTITVFNSGAERMLGYKADEMVGENTPAILHKLDEVIARSEELSKEYGVPIQGFRVFVHKPELEGAETRQWTYIHKDGHELQVSLAVSAMYTPDGELQGYLGVALDITQTEINKRELIGAKDQLSIAADIAELGVWSFDTINDTLDWNDRMFAIYDQPLSLRKTGLFYQHWVERLHPEDAQEAEQMLQETLAGTRSFKGVFRLLLPSKEVRFIQAAAECEKDSNGNVTRIIGINRDITIQQRIENHLREAKHKADEASAAKSSFLANMSHEIRTPMNAVLGMLQLVQKTQLNSRQQDYIVKAESSAKSLLGLLNDILDFSKMESGKLSFDPHPFEFEELMSDLSVLLAANHGDKDVEVLFQLDPNVPRQLITDRLRLQQILTNLASNALKFTTQGHVIVSVVCLGQTREQAHLRFAVTDTGIGISEEQQSRIFNGFEQAESSTTRRFGGTGLGLVISKRLVNLMGGELQLSSELGAGSRFWFDIDLAIADPTPYAQLTQKSLTNIRVLVVDDNPLVADILQQTLSALGFNTSHTNSGLAAIEAVKNAQAAGAPFDVVLMDWRMPDIDGLSAAQSISNNHQLEKPPVIIMVTAYEREVLANQNAASTPYSELLTKPVTPHQLAKSIWQNVTGKMLALPSSDISEEQTTPLQGLHLLVVEDNALNRQIAQELLEAAGATVELADGGLAGVSKVLSGEPGYDLVIMDIQMPDIDGFEATRRIRAHEHFTDLPILAMTANASAADKNACLAAGMNGHLGKPIDMDELVNQILLLLKREVAKPHIPTANSDPQTPIDNAYMILKRFGNKRDLFARMLNNFRPEIIRLLDSLTLHCDNHDLTGATAALHSLKGVASTMGAKLLAQTAATLEAQCKQAQEPQLADIVTQTTREKLLQIFEFSEPLLQRIAQDSTEVESTQIASSTLTDAQIKQQLLDILPLLEADNMGAIDCIETLCEQAPKQPQLVEISELINALDYAQAIRLIQQFLQESHE